MWHSFVSSTDMLANRIVLGFVETSWRFPVTTAAVLLVFLLLTGLLWVEVLRKRVGGSGPDDAGPIRPRRRPARCDRA